MSNCIYVYIFYIPTSYFPLLIACNVETSRPNRNAFPKSPNTGHNLALPTARKLTTSRKMQTYARSMQQSELDSCYERWSWTYIANKPCKPSRGTLVPRPGGMRGAFEPEGWNGKRTL